MAKATFRPPQPTPIPPWTPIFQILWNLVFGFSFEKIEMEVEKWTPLFLSLLFREVHYDSQEEEEKGEGDEEQEERLLCFFGE